MDFVNPEMILKSVLDQQLQHEKNGEYKEAEECRLKYLKQKEDHHNQSMANMQARHKREHTDLKNTWDDELASYNKFWDTKMDEFEKESQNLQKQLKQKHAAQLDKTREDLDRTLPIKVKESSELLNLRKMEEHLAKQKNYVEAKKVQDKIGQMLGQERPQWDANRKIKMETALNTLRGTQNLESENLKQRIKNSRAEKTKERKREEEKINLKYENFMIDMRKLHEKEVLAYKGQFKSLGGTSGAISAPLKSRSTLAMSY